MGIDHIDHINLSRHFPISLLRKGFMEDVVKQVVVFRVVWQVVVTRPDNGVERYFIGGKCFEHLTLAIRYESVFCATDDVNGAAHFFDEPIGSDVVTKQPLDRQEESVTRDMVQKRVVGAIQNDHFGPIPGSDPGGKTAAQGASIQHNPILVIFVGKPLVNVLQVAEKDFLRATATAFAKSPEIKNEKIEAFAHKVFGELTPAFDTARISFDVKNDSFAVRHTEMQCIHHSAIFHVEIDLRKRKRILVSKCLGESFRTKEKQVLPKIEHKTKPYIKGYRPKENVYPEQH